MDFDSKDFSQLIFKKKSAGSERTFTLNSLMLKLVFEMDGTKSISEIAKNLKIPMKDMRSMLQKLIENNLIEIAETRGRFVNGDFMDYLHVHLTEAVGPVAEFLIDDCLSEMGLEKNKIPVTRAIDLVKMLAQESRHKEKKEEFLKTMLNKMFEKGY
jgi:hypothetical protein